MRNLAPGPKFSVLVATVVLITLAVWPIDYAEAEKISAEGQKEKRNTEEEDISLEEHRSADFGDPGADKSAFYQKWEAGLDAGEDDIYSGQSDPPGSNNYEDDGYGYDDDEYDHFNYKRYDNDKSKVNGDIKAGNEENKNSLMGEKRENVAVPEATTIELLSFQAKNMNPMGENTQPSKKEAKIKPFSMKKSPYSEKSEEKEALIEGKLKKKTSEGQKPDGNTSDKNAGDVKVAENKLSEAKDSTENKVGKGKVSDPGTTGSTSVQNLKENIQISENKENSVGVNEGKNEGKITEKDLKGAEAKFQQEEKNGMKMKGEKDMEARIDDRKVDGEAAKDEFKEKNLPQFEANRVDSDYKDGFDNMNDPVIADDEKGSEENGMNLAGLRDSRNDLPYQYSNGFRSRKYIKKKESSKRMPGLRSGTYNPNRDGKALSRGNQYGSAEKEPFHLDFPVADLENTDSHHNYFKSLKRFKNTDESNRILSQGDTPSPYADEAKKYLAPKVIEEEQRKRRSRLRRLKANPTLATVKKRNREEEVDAYDYDPPPRARQQYSIYRRNTLAGDFGQPSAAKKYRRRCSNLLRDACDDLDEFEEGGTKNTKNKRHDDPGFYADDDVTYAEKRKSQGKSAWSGGESSAQKKKLKEASLYEEPDQFKTPLVLLQRNDNGQQAIKTFVDGRYKNEAGVDSEDLARFLSQDSNYVLLKKVPAKEQSRTMNDHISHKSSAGDSKKEKLKITHLDVTLKAQHPSNPKEDIGKLMGTLKEEHADRPLKRKENRIENLSDFFKGDVQDDRDFDGKKEMLMSIDNRMSQYQRGEQNKNNMYKPSLSQEYRHMKDLNERENSGYSGTNLVRMTDQNMEKEGSSVQGPERLLKSLKKGGKEFFFINRPFSSLAVKGKGHDAMMQSLVVPGMAGTAPNVMANTADKGNIAQTSRMFSNGMKMAGASILSANMYQNAILPEGNFQEIKLPEFQKGSDGNRKYFLFGTENDMSNAPRHEVKVIQGGFATPAESTFSSLNYNQQLLNSQNKASSVKNPQGGKAQSLEDSKREHQYGMLQQSYGCDNTQQCLANGYQHLGPSSAAGEGFKRLAKKDKSSDGLERFMREFHDFSQTSYPKTHKSTDVAGMTLEELTSHGDRHLQKLNNLLKEIISNTGEESGNNRAVKNLKRGIFQKYKDQKNWPLIGGRGEEAEVRSGKWTSVVYDGSSQTGYSDEGNSPGESSIKDRKFDGKGTPATLSKDTLLSKRTKRQSCYDSRDSTKILEQKVKSTPYNVQPQPLLPNANGARNMNTNQQHNSPSRACLKLPSDKLMDLLNFFRSENEEFGNERSTNECLCKRNAPAEEKPTRRKLLSLTETESLDETEKRKAECVRKSFESYLDPLVKKLGEYQAQTSERSRRSSDRGKREIELDESMPNDFQNFLVTSVGSFGSQKRGVVKKDEAVWDSEGSGEESTLGKRDTSGNTKTGKAPVSKEDATNIRIKIVDGNGKGELEAGTGVSKEGLKAEESDADAKVHEVYLITNTDSKRRKKKKFASIRSDQSQQKQPISNHLPQVETVYNPNPGSNKAQVEISGDTQMKGKCVQPPTVYNATASMMEDNIIRNNLRTGNINTFTYQHKEEPTPYPLQGPTNPPSSEFEMLNSKSLSRSKTFSNRAFDYGDRYDSSGAADATPDIVYKDQNIQRYMNGVNNGVAMARPGYRSNPMLRVMKSGAEVSSADRYRKDYAEEESAYSEYEDGESFSDESSERQADQDYEEQERQGNRRQDAEENPRAQEHLDPKMMALWNDYARTHLSPERHKEAMERQFQEAYFRSSGQTRYVGGNLNQPNLGVNLIQNLNPNDVDPVDRQKTREKLSKRLAKPSEPFQIGQRFFYTFKSEIPDEEYYSLYQEPSNIKSANADIESRRFENVDKSGVTRLDNGQQAKAKAATKRNSDDFQGQRVKRSEDEFLSAKQTMSEKRHSSGHSTKNQHRNNYPKNIKREEEVEEEEEARDRNEREKRDSLTDFLKADMMRRIEEEKKIRSKVKGLSSDLNKCDIPLNGGLSSGDEVSPPDQLLQHLEDERKEKLMDRNPYLQDQQQQQQEPQPFQYGNLKTGTLDVFKTFEIKRGRREECGARATKERTPSDDGRHSIVSRAESSAYEDRVFLKGVKTREVKKYSNEGFEPLTPDARFSEKSGFYSEESKASDGPYRMPLDEKESTSSSVNRRAGDKKSKAKEAGAGGHQKFQKLTHGFSHEAPLLTPNRPLNSPKIFGALKDNPSPKEVLSLRKHSSESSRLVPADTRDRSHLKSSQESAKEPLVSAVLVVTKREDPSERRIETDYPAQSSFRLIEKSEVSSGEEDERFTGVEKRKAEWPKDAGGDFSRFRPAAQSPEIVNEEADCRSSECQTPAKTVNTKMVHSVKQSSFPFRQLHNDRNGGGTGIGNSGEDILESILGRVESNPHFRKVIGPGLKWRGRKCHAEADNCKELPYQHSKRCHFACQVRKILARFVRDFESLASQDFTQNVCSKLDCSSNKFLHELLDVPFEVTGTCKHRKFLDSLLREPTGSASRSSITGEDASLSAISVEAKENRRDLVARLLEEYHNLPNDEKKSVEVLGQYLSHELNTLNGALNGNGASPARSDSKHEERVMPMDTREGGEANTERAGIASDVTQEIDKDLKPASASAPLAWSNLENVKTEKDDYGAEGPQPSVPMTQISSLRDIATPSKESVNTEPSDESAEATTSYGTEGKKTEKGEKLGQLGKLGYGDAAGLQQSLKSRGLWLSNLNVAKGKPVPAGRVSKRQPAPMSDTVTDVPSPDESSVSAHGFDYQENNVYDVYQAPRKNFFR